MKIYGNLDLRTGELYEDENKVAGIITTTNDTTRNALINVIDAQLAVTLHDYTLNMYDTTSQLWKKFNTVDPIVSVTQIADTKDNITLGTGHVNVPLTNVEYPDRITKDFTANIYFKGEFQNWDVIFRLTGASNVQNSLAVTWNEYYGLCLHVSDQNFKDTRIFPTTNAWHHLNIHQDHTNSKIDFHLDGFRIYQTPTVPLVNPTQLRIGQSDVVDSYDTTSLWVNGFQGKVCQFRLESEITRKQVGNSFTIYPHREVPDMHSEIFIQPKDGVIEDDSINNATPTISGAAMYADNDDSPFTSEIVYNIQSSQHRTFFHNNSTTTDLILLLPPVEDQKLFAFVRFNTTKKLRIRSQFSEYINGLNGNGSAITDWNFIKNDETTNNSIIILKGNIATHSWDIVTIKGVWKDDSNYA